MPECVYTLSEETLTGLQRVHDAMHVSGHLLEDGNLCADACRKLSGNLGLIAEVLGMLIVKIERGGRV